MALLPLLLLLQSSVQMGRIPHSTVLLIDYLDAMVSHFPISHSSLGTGEQMALWSVFPFFLFRLAPTNATSTPITDVEISPKIYFY